MIKKEELCCYLPYNTRIWCVDIPDFADSEWTLCGYNPFLGQADIDDGFWVDIEKIKLILRPLSDLTNPITVQGYNNGNEFIPIAELLKIKHKDTNFLRERHKKIDFKDCYNYVSAWYSTLATLEIIVYKHEINKTPYWIIEKFNQWHIDWSGLIDRGDAIDINTLEK
jgi:hypothetical protein